DAWGSGGAEARRTTPSGVVVALPPAAWPILSTSRTWALGCSAATERHCQATAAARTAKARMPPRHAWRVTIFDAFIMSSLHQLVAADTFSATYALELPLGVAGFSSCLYRSRAAPRMRTVAPLTPSANQWTRYLPRFFTSNESNEVCASALVHRPTLPDLVIESSLTSRCFLPSRKHSM